MLICMEVLVLAMNADIVVKILCSIGIIVAMCFIHLGYKAWLTWIVYGKCDLDFSLTILYQCEKKPDIQIRIAEVYFDLGYYDKCLETIENLNKISSQFSPEENIRFRIIKIHYEAYINGYPSQRNEIEELIRDVKDQNYKTKYLICDLLKCYAENDWEGTIDCIKDFKPLYILSDVMYSYVLGKGYYKTGSCQDAFKYLDFVHKWGGNTRYVTLAKEMIDKMPEEVRKMEIPRKIPKEYNRARFRMIAYFTMAWLLIIAIWVIMFAQG